MGFTCTGCGKQVDYPKIFISESMWEVFKYATGRNSLLCDECILKLCEYIFGFEQDKDIQSKSQQQNL